jgi:hypothetical protein
MHAMTPRSCLLHPRSSGVSERALARIALNARQKDGGSWQDCSSAGCAGSTACHDALNLARSGYEGASPADSSMHASAYAWMQILHNSMHAYIHTSAAQACAHADMNRSMIELVHDIQRSDHAYPHPSCARSDSRADQLSAAVCIVQVAAASRTLLGIPPVRALLLPPASE